MFDFLLREMSENMSEMDVFGNNYANITCDMCKIRQAICILSHCDQDLESIGTLPRIRSESFNQCRVCRYSTWEMCKKYEKSDIETRKLLKVYDPIPRRERLICKELKWINGINKIIAGYC